MDINNFASYAQTTSTTYQNMRLTDRGIVLGNWELVLELCPKKAYCTRERVKDIKLVDINDRFFWETFVITTVVFLASNKKLYYLRVCEEYQIVFTQPTILDYGNVLDFDLFKKQLVFVQKQFIKIADLTIDK